MLLLKHGTSFFLQVPCMLRSGDKYPCLPVCLYFGSLDVECIVINNLHPFSWIDKLFRSSCLCASVLLHP